MTSTKSTFLDRTILMIKRTFGPFLLVSIWTLIVACQGPIDPQTASATNPTQSAAPQPEVPIVKGRFDWPRLLGPSFEGRGVTGEIKFDWSRTPSVAWQLPVGDGYGLGCVWNNRYYHHDARREGRQSVERLRAVELSNADPVWSVERPLSYQDLYDYENGPRGTPTTDGEVIVTFGVDGELICRNLVNGTQRWSVSTNQDFGVVQNFFGVGASPLILDDRVIVPVGGSPEEDQQIAPRRLDRVTPNNSALVAFRLADGKRLWQAGNDLASYSSPRTIEIEGTTAVLYFARDHLMAVDSEDGKLLWKVRHRADILESVNAMMPIVKDDKVFISECYQNGSVLLKVNRDAAEKVWQDPPKNRRKQSMRSHWATPVLFQGYLYGSSGRNNPDSDLRCIEFATGKIRWSDDRGRRTSVALAGQQLVVLDEKGRMQIVQPTPERLDVVAEFDFSDRLTSPCWSAPIIVGNQMLIRGNRSVLCLAIPTVATSDR